MSKLEQQWIEVFRAGDYGDKGKYDASYLDTLVANYNPAKHEAPVVLGHPEHNAPAFGWVDGLKREGNVLFAKLKQVSPQLDQLVESGAFKKRSIMLYRDPPMLRHLGFLGAMPPEVKGLADLKLCEFRDGNREHQAIDFNQESDMEKDELKKSIGDSLKEFFASFRPEKTESKSFSEEDVKRISAEAVKTGTKEISDNLTKVTTEFTEFKNKVTETEKTTKLSGRAGELVSGLKEAKKWIPAFDKMGVSQIFTELVKSESKISFGEGDKKIEKPVADVFSDFLKNLPELVPGGDISGEAAAARKTGKLVQFNEPKTGNMEIDQESAQFAEAAQQMVNDDKTGKLTYGEALKSVRRQAVSGGASANAV